MLSRKEVQIFLYFLFYLFVYNLKTIDCGSQTTTRNRGPVTITPGGAQPYDDVYITADGSQICIDAYEGADICTEVRVKRI